MNAIADSGNPSPSARLSRAVALLVTFVLLAWAGYFMLTGLLEIINFGWRQPMFDQYKMYPNYLEFAFPENLIQLENGHRPILPILIALAEIRWLDANQILQISVGASCAFLMVAILARTAWRQQSLSMPMRAAAVAIVSIGIFWLANARMLLHGNELLHVYVPGLMVILAALCTDHASVGSPVRWMAAATILCMGATFCFGAGIAAFPAIALVAWLTRVPLRAIAVLAVGLAISLIVYLWVLPSDDGVRQMLALRPIDSIATAARWIGSPWVNAWLGFAEPPLYPWMAADAQTTIIGGFVSSSANGIQQLFGVELRKSGSLILGLLGFVALGTIVLKRLSRPRTVSALESVALTMALFGAAISILIGIGRLEYMTILPDQIFADRYLPWSCTFWIGITLLALLGLNRARQTMQIVSLTVLMLTPVLLLPSHRNWAGWGEAVYKNSQASAAAALSDVFDPRIFPNDGSARHMDVAHTLDLFKQHHLGMFTGPEYARLGTQITVRKADSQATADVFGVTMLKDTFNGKDAATFDAIVTDGISWLSKQGPMVVLDSRDRICGFALPSFVDGMPSGVRLKMPRKRGYTGYISNYRESEEYQLGLLNPDLDATYHLATIPRSK